MMANQSELPEPTRHERLLLPPALDYENAPTEVLEMRLRELLATTDLSLTGPYGAQLTTIGEVLERRRAAILESSLAPDDLFSPVPARAEDNPLRKRLYLLDYATLPLPRDSRKELEERYADRDRRFRKRVKQWPRDTKTHDYEELIRGKLLDFHNLLPDNTPLEARQRLLREHANRLLNDLTTLRMVANVAKPDRESRESWLADLIGRRLYNVDELVQEVIAMSAADASVAPPTQQPIPGASDSTGPPDDGAPSEAATESQTGSERPALLSPAKGKRSTFKPIDNVRQQIREMRQAGLSQLEICRRLEDSPRPSNAAWSNLSWPAAFHNPKYRAAVKSWISRLE
jgi:hypothetical protein